MNPNDTKGVTKTSKVEVVISESASLGDLMLVLQETIKLQKVGYILSDDPFKSFYGKTLEFMREDEEVGGSEEILERSVDELELSIRSYNCLKNYEIATIGQLVKKSEAELLASRNFGRKSINEIKEELSKLGLSLRSAT